MFQDNANKVFRNKLRIFFYFHHLVSFMIFKLRIVHYQCSKAKFIDISLVQQKLLERYYFSFVTKIGRKMVLSASAHTYMIMKQLCKYDGLVLKTILGVCMGADTARQTNISGDNGDFALKCRFILFS